MPCHAAMLSNPPRVKVNETVEDVLATMQKKGVSYIAVVDDKTVLQGVFSYRILFKNLLPVSVPLVGGGGTDLTVRAAPGIAKRLKKVAPLEVSTLMDRNAHVVFRDTQTWEGINLIVEHDEPVYVVEHETGKLLGVITGVSAYEELERLQGQA